MALVAFIQWNVSPLTQTFDDRYNLPASMFGKFRSMPRILLLFPDLQQIDDFQNHLILRFSHTRPPR